MANFSRTSTEALIAESTRIRLFLGVRAVVDANLRASLECFITVLTLMVKVSVVIFHVGYQTAPTCIRLWTKVTKEPCPAVVKLVHIKVIISAESQVTLSTVVPLHIWVRFVMFDQLCAVGKNLVAMFALVWLRTVVFLAAMIEQTFVVFERFITVVTECNFKHVMFVEVCFIGKVPGKFFATDLTPKAASLSFFLIL